MWKNKEEKKVAQKSLGMLIYGTTPLLSQSARVPVTHATRELEDRSGVAPHGDFQYCTV